MWIEVSPVESPREILWFGSGGVVAVSPGAIGSILVFSNGSELSVTDGYSNFTASLNALSPGYTS